MEHQIPLNTLFVFFGSMLTLVWPSTSYFKQEMNISTPSTWLRHIQSIMYHATKFHNFSSMLPPDSLWSRSEIHLSNFLIAWGCLPICPPSYSPSIELPNSWGNFSRCGPNFAGTDLLRLARARHRLYLTVSQALTESGAKYHLPPYEGMDTFMLGLGLRPAGEGSTFMPPHLRKGALKLWNRQSDWIQKDLY